MAVRKNEASFAAVDLGSNSFHLLVAALSHGQLLVLDRLRERVALAEGLGPERKIRKEPEARALEALERFGQRLREFSPSRVRAVGTNTLRVARNAPEFLERAERALGHPIEVVSGREEARLIFLGVTHSLADENRRRLVVDVGGGSTECILGDGFEPLAMDSLAMGCVEYASQFFPDGALTRESLKRAQIAASLELSPIRRRYKSLGWETCVGSSGTILAIEEVLRTNGWSDGGITRKGLKRLRKELLAAGHASKLELEGLAADRASVIGAGFAIVNAIFKSFRLERIDVAEGALREGVLYDLAGRSMHDDARERTIRAWQQRWNVDLEHAARVERTALALLEQVADDWNLPVESSRRLLAWAARLFEIGLSVAYSGYHRHGAYLAQNGDMPGFSRGDQAELAALLGAHRRKLEKEAFAAFEPSRAALLLRLVVVLRLAVRLNRSRSPKPLPVVHLAARRGTLELAFPKRWLENHALTRTDLEEEVRLLQAVGIQLDVR
ncbi:MAG: exopolyphosphatase [Planctomycetes bacterium]|nr:exopolyphosphatase [Planctomycetota bacterium]